MPEMSRRGLSRGLLRSGWIAQLLLWLGGCPLLAQAMPDASVTAALRSLNARAGTAFVGEVVAVRRLTGVVEVEFAVQQPVKGVLADHAVLREWGGLWDGAQRRYWVGERALVFLQEPGLRGLSSPVDGMEGVLPVSTAAGSSALEADVQRLRARVLRPTGAPMGDAGGGVMVSALTALLRERAPRRPITLLPNRPLKPVERELPYQRLPMVDVVQATEGRGDDIQ